MWILLLLPFVGLLWVPFYNFQEPALFGFPFFYWYQLAWVPISSLLAGISTAYPGRSPVNSASHLLEGTVMPDQIDWIASRYFSSSSFS